MKVTVLTADERIVTLDVEPDELVRLSLQPRSGKLNCDGIHSPWAHLRDFRVPALCVE